MGNVRLNRVARSTATSSVVSLSLPSLRRGVPHGFPPYLISYVEGRPSHHWEQGLMRMEPVDREKIAISKFYDFYDFYEIAADGFRCFRCFREYVFEDPFRWMSGPLVRLLDA